MQFDTSNCATLLLSSYAIIKSGLLYLLKYNVIKNSLYFSLPARPTNSFQNTVFNIRQAFNSLRTKNKQFLLHTKLFATVNIICPVFCCVSRLIRKKANHDLKNRIQ